MRRALASRGEAQHLGLGPVLSTGWLGFVVGSALHHKYAYCYHRDRLPKLPCSPTYEGAAHAWSTPGAVGLAGS